MRWESAAISFGILVQSRTLHPIRSQRRKVVLQARTCDDSPAAPDRPVGTGAKKGAERSERSGEHCL